MPVSQDFIILVLQKKKLRLKKEFPKITQLENGRTETEIWLPLPKPVPSCTVLFSASAGSWNGFNLI